MRNSIEMARACVLEAIVAAVIAHPDSVRGQLSPWMEHPASSLNLRPTWSRSRPGLAHCLLR
jgi:hypothetical protein